MSWYFLFVQLYWLWINEVCVHQSRAAVPAVIELEHKAWVFNASVWCYKRAEGFQVLQKMKASLPHSFKLLWIVHLFPHHCGINKTNIGFCCEISKAYLHLQTGGKSCSSTACRNVLRSTFCWLWICDSVVFCLRMDLQVNGPSQSRYSTIRLRVTQSQPFDSSSRAIMGRLTVNWRMALVATHSVTISWD